MDCSTCHIKQEDDEWLKTHVEDDEPYGPGINVTPHDYGYWIHVPIDEGSLQDFINDERIPTSLKDIMRKAFHAGCIWVKLDCDGYAYHNLPQYDW